MPVCEVCGNAYDKSFEVMRDGRKHVFDCFECAISSLAPTCANCGVRIVGHGVEANHTFFCSAHCASQKGVTSVQDRA